MILDVPDVPENGGDFITTFGNQKIGGIHFSDSVGYGMYPTCEK